MTNKNPKKTFKKRPDIKIILDAAYPLTKDGPRDLAQTAESLGVYTSINKSDEYTGEKVYSVYPKQLKNREHGKAIRAFLRENTAGGFLEDILPASMITSELVEVLKSEVDIRKRSFSSNPDIDGPATFHAFIEDGGTRERILEMVRRQAPTDRLKHGAARQRLFRTLDAWASTPTAAEHELDGDKDRSATRPVSVHALKPKLSRRAVTGLQIKPKAKRVEAVVVIGSLRPGRLLSPLAACPVYIDKLADGSAEVKIKPLAIPLIYPGKLNKILSEEDREYFEVIDLPLSLTPKWKDFWPAFQKEVADWISETYGADVEDLDTFSFKTPDGEHTISAWIEREVNGGFNLSSLASLSKLSRVRPERVTGAAQILTSPPEALEPLGRDILRQVRCRRHMCHTDTTFPLDPFQSKAAINIAALDELGHELWMQSVNGPPGTGKTSMMKSVIADAILKKVWAGEPARMLICGPTHQASNNLLGAITYDWDKALLPSGRPHPLAARWMPLGDTIGAQNAVSTALEEGIKDTNEPSILQFVGTAQELGPNLEACGIEGTGKQLAYSVDLKPFIQLFGKSDLLAPATEQALSLARQSLSRMRRCSASIIPSGLEGLNVAAGILRGMLDHSVEAILAIHNETEEIEEVVSPLFDEIKRLKAEGYHGLKLKALWQMMAKDAQSEPPGKIGSHLRMLTDRLNWLREHLVDLAHFDDPAFTKISEGILTTPKEADLENLPSMADRLLDTKIRYECFLIAFRLSEVEALRGVHAYHRALREKEPKPEICKAVFDALAFAYPVRAMTTHSAGGKASRHFGTAADLVIVDEAGQMGPEFVPGIAAEADRVLAVGDPYQIPPILSQSPLLRKLSEGAELPRILGDLETVWTHEDRPLKLGQAMPDKGANGISIVEAHAPWRGPLAPVLQGHYRCPESIISISNLVTYQPRGIALIPHILDPDLAPGDIPIIGSLVHCAEPEGTTENWFEADMIARWAVDRLPDILALARKDDEPVDIERDIGLMKKAIAFISPFRNQADKTKAAGSRKAYIESKLGDIFGAVYVGLLPNLLKFRLLEKYPDLKPKIDDIIGAKKEGVVFGTIHALQGAECPVVALSCVSNGDSKFFDRDPSLTNVGVSRAKRSLVIAHHEKFGSGSASSLPSSILVTEASRYPVIWPERIVMVEAPNKVEAVQAALGPSSRVIATGGSISRPTGLTSTGAIRKEWGNTSAVEGARRWLMPVELGGAGVQEIVLATDADPAGDAIGEDIMEHLGLSDPEIPKARSITVSRWPLTDAFVDPADLAVSFEGRTLYTSGLTDARSAQASRLRTILRAALTRRIAEGISGPGGAPDPWVALFMKEMLAGEVPGLAVRVTAEDKDGNHIRAILRDDQGNAIRFPSKQEVDAFIAEKTGAKGTLLNMPLSLPFPTKRSSFDMAILGSWIGLQPHEVMQILKRFYETPPEALNIPPEELTAEDVD